MVSVVGWRGEGKVNIREYGVLFWSVVGVVALLVASPVLSRVLVYPRTEFFTELWLLDADGRAENYPFNVSVGGEYVVRLGVGNRLGRVAYYLVEVKFRNASQPLPSSFGPIEERVPSGLASLFGVRAFVADEGVWTLPLVFSLDYWLDEELGRVVVTGLVLNGVAVSVNDCVVGWDVGRRGFLGQLFFELWLFDQAVGGFGYHGRFVSLWLNMTV